MLGQELLLSIIIPNFNSGTLLKRAVDSVLQDAAISYEIVVVDDGSTDSSAQDLAPDDRIKVFYQKNLGVSAARNRGLHQSRGKYVLFLDADDKLESNWGRKLADIPQLDADIVMFNYYVENRPMRIISETRQYGVSNSSNLKQMMMKNPTKWMTVWSKIFRRDFIFQCVGEFNQQLKLAEDGDFMLRCLLSAKSIIVNTSFLYCYLNSKRSVMRNFSQDKVNGYLKAMLISRQNIVHQPAEVQHAFSYYVAMHLNVMMVHQIFDLNNPLSVKQKKIQLRAVLTQPIIQNSLQDIRLIECN